MKIWNAHYFCCLSYLVIMAATVHARIAACQPTPEFNSPPGRESIVEAGPKVFFAVINDSQTGTLERGQKGYYIGPDDFITGSVMLRAQFKDWRSALTYNNLTSRKFKYRYDLMFFAISRKISINKFEIQPGLGLVWKGNCGGDKVQNWLHRQMDLPELHVPYCKGGTTAFLSTIGSKQVEVSYLKHGLVTVAGELRVLGDFVPSRLGLMVGYQTKLLHQRYQFELLGGARFYLNEIENYSQLVRSGPFLGASSKIRISRKIYFDFGISFFPVQNLENDPAYAYKEHHYFPQIIVALSWDSAWYRLYNFLEY